MFKVEERIYTDCEGRNSKWTASEFVATIAEAEAIAETITAEFPCTGDYRIIATTMDEATFTITEEVVKTFNYWKEVKRVEEAKRTIATYEAKIEEAEEAKKRCRTEAGIAKKDKEIAQYRARIEEENRWI